MDVREGIVRIHVLHGRKIGVESMDDAIRTIYAIYGLRICIDVALKGVCMAIDVHIN